jgi:hypothetical protein
MIFSASSASDAEWVRDTAMNVMLATQVDEAVRILSLALSKRSANSAADRDSPTADRHYDDIDDPNKTGLADLMTRPAPSSPVPCQTSPSAEGAQIHSGDSHTIIGKPAWNCSRIEELEALVDLIREEAGKDNSPLGRSDSLALDRIRKALAAGIQSSITSLAAEPWKGEAALADVRRLMAEAKDEVEPIVGGPEGETIMAYKIPTGLWLMLQARIRNMLDHLPPPAARALPNREGM